MFNEQTHENIPIDFHPKWLEVLKMIKEQFGKKPDLETILFLIGINELGTTQNKFSKEEKQDLMHIATCRLLSYEGYYTLLGIDTDNWPVWEIACRIPAMNNEEQESLLKRNILRYFEEKKLFTTNK
ncbi:MAG: hypothetical protein ACKVPJ_11800 [Chitinophagales bacterium]